ncbi:CDP-alcohol phosphatidyltransferase family protein [Actinomadura vinacea]
MPTFSLRDVRATCKERDAWWTVLLVDPLAIRLTRLLAARTAVTPGQITVVAFALGLGAAGCFVQGTPGWLALGALLYHAGFVLDCCDGKIARLKGLGTPFGAWLDFMLDRVRDGACAMALAHGLYTVTGQAAYWGMACAILALDMFRYLNGAQIAKARRAMRELEAELGAALQRTPPEVGTVPRRGDGAAARLRHVYARVRDFLLRHRIRMHLVSGIEFQMAAFIVGPLTGFVLPVVAVAGLMLLLFEIALIVRFCHAVRRFVPEPLAAARSASAPAA